MAISLKIRIRWGYVIAFLMLLISYFLIFYIMRRLAEEANWVSHSYEVINKLESVKAEVTDAETGVRGYIITKDIRYLKPYNTGSKNSELLFNDLKRLTIDNTTIQPKLDTLGRMIHQRLSYLSYGVSSFQRGGYVINDSVKMNREASRGVMDSLRIYVKELQDSEYALMRKRMDTLEGFFRATEVIAITSLLITLITVVYSLFIYNRESRAKEASNAKVKQYSVELEQRVGELNTANDELEELKGLEKFAATGRIARTMAHEVRNPLTNIALASEQLKEMPGRTDESEVLLDMIGRNVSRINQLVSDLLNSTRFAQLEYTTMGVNALMEDTLELAKDRIELNHVKVHKNYERQTCEVYVDKEKMKLALLNIIVNALEATGKTSGQLQVVTRKMRDKCVIEITDNGIGMDDDTIQRLFEPYFTSKVKGNGLGLTNTQNIILNHKGNIIVKSKLGQGSTFTVTLNVQEENLAT